MVGLIFEWYLLVGFASLLDQFGVIFDRCVDVGFADLLEQIGVE